MATPAAVLSVLLDANTTEATAKLTKYQAQLDKAEVQAKRGISTRLGGTFDDRAFVKYQAATASAMRKAADRRAFKAELGANYSPAGFRAYTRAVDQAEAQNAKLAASTAKADIATTRLSGSVERTGGRLKEFAGAFAGVGFGVGVVAAESVKAGMDFQRSMEMVYKVAGTTQKQVESLSRSVLELSGTTATAPDELAKGLFHLTAQGLKGARALDALAVAAKGAKIGQANLEDVTNALGAAVASQVKGTSNVQAAMASMITTVKTGDMTMQQLAEAFGTGLLGPMKQFGVNLQDINAALAVFGDNNIRGADAGTKLGSAIRIMAAPSKQSAKYLDQINLSATQLANDLRSGPGGLLKAMEDLKQHLEDAGLTASQQARVLALAFGGRQATGVQLLLGQLERLRTKEEEVGKGANDFSALWEQTKKTSKVQLDQITANLQRAGIMIAAGLQPVLPVLVKITGSIDGFIMQMRTGQGAGGRFARDVKQAFEIVKTAVHDVVDAFGGWENTLEVIAGGWAVKKLLGFAGALGGTVGRLSAAFGGGGAAATGATAAAGPGGKVTGALGRLSGVLSKASALAFLAPVGIALGAVLDHWIKTNAEAEGKEFANKFLAPMPASIKQHFEEPLAKASQGVTDAFGKAARNTLTRLQGQGKATTGLGRAGALLPPSAPQAGPSAADAAAIQKAYFTIGQKAGQATVAGLHSVKDVSGPILLQDFLGRLRQLPGMARPEAAKAMLQFAETLQQQGKLPAKAFEAILHSLEAQIPGFDYYLQRQGLASDQSFAKALRFNTATNTLRNTLAGYRTQFGDWQIATKITGSNIVQNMATAMQHLHQTVKSSSGQTRKDAVSELQKLHDQATSLFSSMASKTAQAAKDMRGSITSSTSQAARDASSNLAGLANAIYGGVKSGAINSKQGAQYIQQALNATLKAFGATPIPAVTLKEVALSTPFSAKVGAFPKTGQAGGGGKPAGAARGGLMQFGRPGQAGRDSIPLNVGGMPIAVAPGEQVAVFNRHQLPIVNSALAPLGGLPGLFSKVRTPNFMASGGMVNFDGHPGNVSSGVRGLISTMESRFPGLIVTATTDGGHAAGSYHYRGDAVDMASDATTMLSAANYVRTSGLYKSLIEGIHNPNLSVHAGQFVSPSFWGASTWAQHANHIHLAILGALGALAGGIGQISAPQVKGGGTIGRMLRAGLGKVAGAANAYLGSHAGGGDLSGAGLGVGGGGGAGTAANAALWTQAGGPKAVARIAGAIAMAESGGRDIIQQGVDYAHKGWGRWQITPGNSEPQFGIDNALLIPMNNARAAVAKYMTARGGPGFGPWTTYTSGAYRAFLARGGLLGFAGGGLPFAGSFHDGGVVPGPIGKEALALVRGGEFVAPGFAGGGSIIGRALAGHPAWRIPLNLPALATIPSQSSSGQIKLQGIQNQLTSAQNTGNVGGQKSALKRILSLEQKWLSADRRQLKKLNKALKQKGLTKKQRQSLLGDKLALLQEIGTVEADIGSTQTSLSDLTSTDTTGTDTTGTDTSGGDTTDSGAQALADAISAQTQALTDATNAINQQTAAINGIGAIEKQQAIKALADVISGQIGGQYYSRATGSAGDGRVARY